MLLPWILTQHQLPVEVDAHGLILLKEPLHVSVRFCVFVLNNEFTPAMANLKKREKNPISNKLVGFLGLISLMMENFPC